ncbi:hypothetical protein [Streptomyces uncialis]|uniref:hypothetical protein n=1 Tax=Streptomyces uncialis TaxID=1048205 RepID=UPI000ABFDBAE|nr:hypothetical protein [Streptomyces uncialis]
MNQFVQNHGVRLLAVLAALAPILLTRFPGVPWEALAATGAALLGVGELAQRAEDGKTAAALLEPSPWDRVSEQQATLTAMEAEFQERS